MPVAGFLPVLTFAHAVGVRQGWERWVGDHGSGVGVNRYGASAPGSTVLEEYGFTVDNVVAKAKALLG